MANALDPTPATPELPNGTWVADLTGPQLNNGVTSTDLGEPRLLPDGRLIFFFGDTFSGLKVGEGDWRSPVALIGKWDFNPAHPIVWDVAAGADPNYAQQLIPYTHDSPPAWTNGGISTRIPSDAIVVDGVIYLHVIANHGFGNVPYTEIWSSADNGASWKLVTNGFAGNLHNGLAQLWSWDYCPEDGYIYVVSTGFQRDKGMILRRVLPQNIGIPSNYETWGWSGQNSKWAWGNEPTPITPDGETWGELSLRRIGKGKWILGGLVLSQSALGYRVFAAPTDNLHLAPLQLPVLGSTWADNDPAHGKVAQVYGGFVLPGAQLDVEGGVGLVVSQWNTHDGSPYKAMQFRATIKDTTATAS
jgi:Domain of unknown function (DUF4185)